MTVPYPAGTIIRNGKALPQVPPQAVPTYQVGTAINMGNGSPFANVNGQPTTDYYGTPKSVPQTPPTGKVVRSVAPKKSWILP